MGGLQVVTRVSQAGQPSVQQQITPVLGSLFTAQWAEIILTWLYEASFNFHLVTQHFLLQIFYYRIITQSQFLLALSISLSTTFNEYQLPLN